MADEAKLCSPIHLTYEVLVVQCAVGITTRKNWALSVDQCQLQALQILVYLIDLLSILLRCNSFTRIQKAVVDQTGSRPPYSDCDPFFWCKLGIGKCFGASPQSNHRAGCCHLSYKIYFSSHVTIQSKNDSLQNDFLICGQLRRHLLIKLFHLSNLLQMSNDHRMVNVEFLGNLSCCRKRISFDDCSQLMVNFQWPAITLIIFKVLFSFAKLLEPPLHCTFISGSWTLSLLLYNPF